MNRETSLLPILLAVLMLTAQAGAGTTLVVDSTADDFDLGANGNCTLREAILAANTNSAVDACPAGEPGPGFVDQITLSAGTYPLTVGPGGDDAGQRGDLDLADDVVLRGAGAASTIVDANQLDRVLEVHTGIAATIEEVTLTGGANAGPGGGVFNQGILTLSGCVVDGNSSTTQGGGVRNSNDLTVVASTFSGNQASDHGGGLDNHGTASFVNSTVSGNTSGSAGGGLYNQSGRQLTLLHVTVTGNSGTPADAVLIDGALTVTGSILVGDCAGGGPVTTTGGSLESPGDTCGLGAGDQVNVLSPLLGSLADNGGSTPTHALLAGSPAIDTANDLTCPALDQRDLPRPADGDGDGNAVCDGGSVERGAQAATAIFSDGFESGDTGSWSATAP